MFHLQNVFFTHIFQFKLNRITKNNNSFIFPFRRFFSIKGQMFKCYKWRTGRKYQEKEERKECKRRIRARAKEFITTYKAERCCDECGYNADTDILCFHHLKDKRHNLSECYSRGLGIKKIKEDGMHSIPYRTTSRRWTPIWQRNNCVLNVSRAGTWTRCNFRFCPFASG